MEELEKNKKAVERQLKELEQRFKKLKAAGINPRIPKIRKRTCRDCSCVFLDVERRGACPACLARIKSVTAELLKLSGVTQKQLANKMNVPYCYIGRWLNYGISMSPAVRQVVEQEVQELKQGLTADELGKFEQGLYRLVCKKCARTFWEPKYSAYCFSCHISR